MSASNSPFPFDMDALESAFPSTNNHRHLHHPGGIFHNHSSLTNQPPHQPAPSQPDLTPSFLTGDSFFRDEYSPPSPINTHYNFLNTILNPTTDASSSHPPHANHRHDPLHSRPLSPSTGSSYFEEPDMARPSVHNTNRSHRTRQPNAYVDVDLTSPTDTPSESIPSQPQSQSQSQSQTRRLPTPTPGPSSSSKRQRANNGTAIKRDAPNNDAQAINIEEIDLLDETTSVQKVLQKQRQEAVKQQQKENSEKPTTFNTFTCVICMDNPTDLTATVCGHLFCHTCLMEALIAGENRTGPGEPKRSQCPVCRKVINRNKSTDIIPLLLKKGLATQPRKSKASGGAAAAATAASASEKTGSKTRMNRSRAPPPRQPQPQPQPPLSLRRTRRNTYVILD